MKPCIKSQDTFRGDIIKSNPKVADATRGKKENLKFKVMANYATNIFHASTENKQDLDKIEAFLDDNFNGFVNRYGEIGRAHV